MFSFSLLQSLFTLMLMLTYPIVECQECPTSELNVFDGYRYVFYHGDGGDGTHRTFNETRAHCQSLGGDMPIITSAEQNLFIAMRLTEGEGNYYIGLGDMDEDGTYKWIDGTDPGYTNWDTSLYTDPPPYCAVMRSRLSLTDPIHGRWNQVTCTSGRRHICQIPVVEGQECSTSGLDVFGVYQYVFYRGDVVRTFSETRAYCQSLGGDIPIITSAEQNDFMAMRLTEGDGNYYIGLEDMDEDGTYRWIYETDPGRYTNWDNPLYTESDQPPPNCAVMRSRLNLTDPIHGRWNQVTCTSVRRHICQIPVVECQEECPTSELNVFGGYQYVFYHGDIGDGIYRTFSETRAHCQSLGGDMPIITSAEQNDFIAGKLSTDSDYGHYYIGLQDMDEDGAYRWIDGTNPGYTNWDTPLYTEPTNPPPYCAVMRSRLSLTDPIHGRWNRVTCTSERRHICQIPIGDGCRWQELGESQYLIKFTSRATPSAAREACHSYGGDLAFIKTAEVNTFLKALLPPCNSSDPYYCYWFGLRRSGLGDFTWLDDSTLQYNDWYTTTDPNDADSWGCLGLRDGPSWYDQTSQQSLPYICERTRVFDGGSEASFGGRDYFTSPSWLARSFSDARTFCQDHGADLALIKSHDINTFLHGRISGLSNPVFFGLTDQEVEGMFRWIDGTPLQYSAWRDSEPNDDVDEDCVTLSSDADMGWLDITCNLDQPFICERYQNVPENEWSRFDGTLYYISQSSMTSYSFARRFCQAQGGDLAQPKTEEINMHLIQLAEGNSYWFGLDDSNPEGTFKWIDDTLLDNNVFPAWSNVDATLFQDERCVHQQVDNGWRKLPCTTYLRFACEKPPNPRPILPVRLMAATTSPYRGDLPNASFLCLLGSENEEILALSTRRLVRLTAAISPDSYTAPGDINDVSPAVLRQTLPASLDGLGFFECSAVTASRMSSVPLAILLSTRQLQPSDGRFTKTVQVGDDITLSAMSTTGMVGEDGIRWRKFTDEDWANSLIGMSSDSLSHTIQSASISDAGVYVTYMDGTLEQHQFSFIRLIVKECPYGRWNPWLCDRLCDSCYNGGVCHELSGTCICPPGHAGKNCLQACGRHRYGWDCEFECGTGQPLDRCAGSQICLPDPYGCTCLAGYTGINCDETCVDGMFGADCLQECHCTDEADCNDFTGECPGDCSQGWSGATCQVPSVCPIGYFGTDCTQRCNCKNATACEKESGFCTEVEGICDFGYFSYSVDFPSSCITFLGCYSSCLKTCHCSGGVEDCNFLTGDCLSSTCHPRWIGEQCQTDRFETSSVKTNPGVAIFSCSFTASPGQAISLKAAQGDFSSRSWIPHSNVVYIDSTLNITFVHVNMEPEQSIYCFVGDPEIPSEFVFIRLHPRHFFVLPSFNGVPQLLELGYYYAVIGWRQWDSSSDTGDGPIVGYKIYVRSGSNVVLAKEVQHPSMVNNTDHSVSKRSAENANEMVMYNVSGLEAGSTYSIQIAAIRDGINGEGEQGAALIITTNQAGGSSSFIPTVAGSAVGAFVVIVIVIVIIIIFYKRRSNESATTTSKGKESGSSPQYDNPVFDPSKADVNTYQDRNNDHHTYQDINTDAQSRDNPTGPHTYQDLQKPDQEANYEELTDAIQGDYVNVEGI